MLRSMVAIMTTKRLMHLLRTRLQDFRESQGGNVVFMFAFATIPMIGLVGASVDYSRANSARSAMQAAVDAAALMLSKDIATLQSGDIASKAQAYFAAL